MKDFVIKSSQVCHVDLTFTVRAETEEQARELLNSGQGELLERTVRPLGEEVIGLVTSTYTFN